MHWVFDAGENRWGLQCTMSDSKQARYFQNTWKVLLYPAMNQENTCCHDWHLTGPKALNRLHHSSKAYKSVHFQVDFILCGIYSLLCIFPNADEILFECRSF